LEKVGFVENGTKVNKSNKYAKIRLLSFWEGALGMFEYRSLAKGAGKDFRYGAVMSFE
jgi:hypothetical protein